MAIVKWHCMGHNEDQVYAREGGSVLYVHISILLISSKTCLGDVFRPALFQSSSQIKQITINELNIIWEIFHCCGRPGVWRKPHNEEVHNLYCSPSIIRMIKSKGVTWIEHIGRPRPTWVDNVKMDLREIDWGGMGWIDLAQDGDQWKALVNTVMNFRVP
jgi:hypothetical protein